MQKLDFPIPEAGTLTKVAADLYWARFALPFRLNHINLYMIDTEAGWLLVDAGINQDETAAQWQVLLDGPLSHQAVAGLLITHHHVDHLGYAGALSAKLDIPVYASASEADFAHWMFTMADDEFADLVADTYVNYGLDETHVAQARADKGRFRRHVKTLPDFTIIEEGHLFPSRHGTWQVRIDRGHSQGQISLVDDTRGLLIAVDFLLPRISPNISVDLRDFDDDMLGHYLTYCEAMTSLPDQTQIFPGHDWPFTQGGARAAQLIDHHHQRLDSLLEAAKNGPLTVADGMRHLFGKSFGPHELYFASGEARAHLWHLVQQGAMKCEDKGGTTYFSRQPDV